MPGPDSSELDAAVLDVLFTQAPWGLYVFDEDLRVVRYNAAARDVRGLRPEAVLGRRLGEFAEGFDDPELAALARQVLAGATDVRDHLVRGRSPNDPGHEMTVSLSLFRIRLADGRVRGVAVVQNVTATRRATGRLDILHDAHRSIGTSLDVRATAEALGDVVVSRFADTVTVDVLDDAMRGAGPGSGPVRVDAPLRRVAFRSVTGAAGPVEPGGLSSFAFPTPFTQSLLDARPRLVAHLAGDEPWLSDDAAGARTLPVSGVHSLVVTPLTVRGTVLGVVGHYRHRNPEPYDDEDLALAVQLAQRTALSIDNCRSYARERTIATTLQRHLLPRTPPALTAVETMPLHLPGTVGAGGDWYDVIPLSGARVALTVGDVTGSGIEAAAAMGQLRTALMALAVRDLAPEELLASLDEVAAALPHEPGEPVTASCLYAVFDPVTRTCTAADAGHPLPVAVTPDGEPVPFDVPVGPLLGTGSADYESASAVLPDGALLALFTDGLAAAPGGPAAAAQTLRRVLRHPGRTLQQLSDDAVYALMRGQGEDDAVLLLARTCGLDDHDIAEWTLPDDPAVVPAARRLAERQLAAWGLDDLAFATELVVSELVTNAIRYGTPPIRLRMIRDRVLGCEVSDGSSTAPHLRHAQEHDEGGRGLCIIAQLAERWGTRFGRRGKTIWCEQELIGAEEGDEPEHDGSVNDGPEHDGPEQDGPEHDGPEQDGPEQNGPEQNGPVNDGPAAG
ncbi:SpoIIE family protein phosphatase [Streptomyces longispororuber]|uniref:SpoIIE family protein phosphatase n=1 Tax=Streptomyces longispororuber TaxID=68230 RepID=UPI00210A7E06|nr:SpoIIE family protein phosphatase [Streptomyces longispororuber]MCQ4210941.1 SpoIIE family protein phosphatase [Streptomyces longispororuber]